MAKVSRIPYLRRSQSRIGETGRKAERKLAQRLGGRARPASGAMEGAKGDIEIDDFLMEAKSTVKDSVTLKFGWLSKIAHEARNMGKKPALAVTYTFPDGTPVRDGAWVLVPLRVWEENLK